MTPQFVTTPVMVGEIYAAQVYTLALDIQDKYVKTPLQSKLFKACIDTRNEDWHYWLIQLGKTYVERVRYAVRHVHTLSPFELYCKVENGSPMLKSDLIRWAELYAYTHEQKAFLTDYVRGMRFYGMSTEESIERCHRYMASLKEKYGYEVK